MIIECDLTKKQQKNMNKIISQFKKLGYRFEDDLPSYYYEENNINLFIYTQTKKIAFYDMHSSNADISFFNYCDVIDFLTGDYIYFY